MLESNHVKSERIITTLKAELKSLKRDITSANKAKFVVEEDKRKLQHQVREYVFLCCSSHAWLCALMRNEPRFACGVTGSLFKSVHSKEMYANVPPVCMTMYVVCCRCHGCSGLVCMNIERMKVSIVLIVVHQRSHFECVCCMLQDEEVVSLRGIVEDLTRQRNEAEEEVVELRKQFAEVRADMDKLRRHNAVREGAMQRDFRRRYVTPRASNPHHQELAAHGVEVCLTFMSSVCVLVVDAQAVRG